ncbi:hypothetical protein [Anditalea andensis]|uniref:Uncharacterized protein n=1 Tax=Anditalea andensis TaxID=1048983 RepID=A0A074LD83_9BACT|nr:hypothetical protein [Anditalea andensis]KEO71742.1 hypothetical protein EL17_21390 [Anditalea andensis]
MTAQEILENETSNHQFKTLTAEVELVQKYLLPGTKDEHDQFFTATDICQYLAANGNANLRLSSIEVSKAMKTLGHIQSQKRRNPNQAFPEKGYYIKLNYLTTYYK